MSHVIPEWKKAVYGTFHALLTLDDYQTIPRVLKLRGYEVSIEEYEDKPGLMTVTFWHPRYTRWRRRRYERTHTRIYDFVMQNKVVGTRIEVVLRPGPKAKPDWYLHPRGTLPPEHPNCRCTPISVDGKHIGFAEFENAVIDYVSSAYHVPRRMIDPDQHKIEMQRRTHIEFKNAEMSMNALAATFGIKHCRRCGTLMRQVVGFDTYNPERVGVVHGWSCPKCDALMFEGEPKLLSTKDREYFRAHPELAKALIDAAGDTFEQCDVCHKLLNKMDNEDCYIESENKVLCAEHYAEWRKMHE